MTKTWSWKNVDTTFHLFLYFNILINLSLYRLSLTLSSYFSIFLFTSIFTCLLIYLCIYLFMHLSLLISISLYLSILLSLFNQFIYPFHLYLSQSIQFLFGVSLPVHLSSFLLHIFSFRSISLSLSSNHLMSCFFPLISFIFTLCQTAQFLIRAFLHLSVFVANSPFLFLFSLISVLQSLRCFNLLPNGNSHCLFDNLFWDCAYILRLGRYRFLCVSLPLSVNVCTYLRM